MYNCIDMYVCIRIYKYIRIYINKACYSLSCAYDIIYVLHISHIDNQKTLFYLYRYIHTLSMIICFNMESLKQASHTFSMG